MRHSISRYNPFLIAILLLIPLVVHERLMEAPHDLWMFAEWKPEIDLFTFWKAALFVPLAWLAFAICSARIPPLLYIFLSLLFLATFTSHFSYLSMYGAPNYNEGALCFFGYIGVALSASVFDRTRLDRCLKLSVALVGLFCLLQQFSANFLMLPGIHWLTGAGEIMAKHRPIYGTLGNPNHLGLYCGLMLPYLLATLSRIRDLPLVLLAGWMGIATYSRGFLFSFFAVLVYLIWTTSKHRLYKAIALILGVLFFIFVVRPHYHSEWTSRLFIWKHSLSLLWDTKILGAGPGSFMIFFPQGRPDSFDPTVLIDRPHNFLLQVWQGMGLLALISLLAFIVLSFRKGSPAAKASIIGFMTASLFTDSMVGVTPLFFAIVGSCWITDEPKKNFKGPFVDKELTKVSMSYLCE